MPSGHKSFVALARGPTGKQVWATLGECQTLSLEEARQAARSAVRRIKDGQLAKLIAEQPRAVTTFSEVLDVFLVRHVDKYALRSAAEIRRIFRVYVLPRWANRSLPSITRGDVARLLDDVEDNNGEVMADRVLAAVSKLFNWYASREDDYSSPVVRGMGRANGRERARRRIFDDAEIRLFWQAAGQAGTFGACARIALLTGQRREKVVSMCWSDIQNGVWTIPVQLREKNNGGSLRLPEFALEVLAERPRLTGNPYIFAGRSSKPINGFSKSKKALDAAITQLNNGQPIAPWVFHDLRRTAKSLMSRAGVPSHVSERTTGHIIKGVEGIYDRHDYFDEKAEALDALAKLVAKILKPSMGHVQ
jgi:integrase